MHQHITQPMERCWPDLQTEALGKVCALESGCPHAGTRVRPRDPWRPVEQPEAAAMAIGVGDRFEQVEARRCSRTDTRWAGEDVVAGGGGRPEFVVDPAPRKTRAATDPRRRGRLNPGRARGPASLNRLRSGPARRTKITANLRRHITSERQPVLLRAEPR